MSAPADTATADDALTRAIRALVCSVEQSGGEFTLWETALQEVSPPRVRAFGAVAIDSLIHLMCPGRLRTYTGAARRHASGAQTRRICSLSQVGNHPRRRPAPARAASAAESRPLRAAPRRATPRRPRLSQAARSAPVPARPGPNLRRPSRLRRAPERREGRGAPQRRSPRPTRTRRSGCARTSGWGARGAAPLLRWVPIPAVWVPGPAARSGQGIARAGQPRRVQVAAMLWEPVRRREVPGKPRALRFGRVFSGAQFAARRSFPTAAPHRERWQKAAQNTPVTPVDSVSLRFADTTERRLLSAASDSRCLLAHRPRLR